MGLELQVLRNGYDTVCMYAINVFMYGSATHAKASAFSARHPGLLIS